MMQARLFLLHLQPENEYRASDISRKGYDLLAYAMNKCFLPEDAHWSIGRKEHGKPYIAEYPDLFFNISHSGEYIALLLAKCEVGVDIQIRQGRCSKRLLERIFSEEEMRAYESACDQEAYFFDRWALKESFVKWTGEGITRSLRALPDRGWQRLLNIAEGYSCAVCASEELAVCVIPVIETDGHFLEKCD